MRQFCENENVTSTIAVNQESSDWQRRFAADKHPAIRQTRDQPGSSNGQDWSAMLGTAASSKSVTSVRVICMMNSGYCSVQGFFNEVRVTEGLVQSSLQI